MAAEAFGRHSSEQELSSTVLLGGVLIQQFTTDRVQASLSASRFLTVELRNTHFPLAGIDGDVPTHRSPHRSEPELAFQILP